MSGSVGEPGTARGCVRRWETRAPERGKLGAGAGLRGRRGEGRPGAVGGGGRLAGKKGLEVSGAGRLEAQRSVGPAVRKSWGVRAEACEVWPGGWGRRGPDGQTGSEESEAGRVAVQGPGRDAEPGTW